MSGDRAADVARLAEALPGILRNPVGKASRPLSEVIDALLPVVDAIADERAAEVQAAIGRVTALADELDAISDEHWDAYKRGGPDDTRRGSAYTEGFCTGYDSAAQRIRATLRGTP